MKQTGSANILLILIFILGNYSLAQNQVRCGDAISTTKGTLIDSSSVRPQLQSNEIPNLQSGAMGELALLNEDEGFKLTISIAKVRILEINADTIHFEVLEKYGKIVVDGVEKSLFKAGASVQFTQYMYDKPELIETQWPSGSVRETGYVLCNKKMGEWHHYHDNGAPLTTYRTDKNGDIEGRYVEYFPNGVCATEGEYRSGKKAGLWTEYFDTGKIKSQGYYYQGKKSGQWIEHNEKGKKVKRIYDSN